MQRLFERLNQIQQRNLRRITINYRRTIGIQRPRIGRSFIYPRQQRLIRSLQGQIKNEDDFTNSDIINNFMNELRNNQNTERQLIRYGTITNIPNVPTIPNIQIKNNFMKELGIHSKSIEENKSIKSNSLQTNYISDVTHISDISDNDLFISEEEIERRKKEKNKFLSPEEYAEENERKICEREQVQITNIQQINPRAAIQDEITISIDTPINTDNLQPVPQIILFTTSSRPGSLMSIFRSFSRSLTLQNLMNIDLQKESSTNIFNKIFGIFKPK
ncbi:7564_t:CDS:2 [Scutellospora calospora]|uniref:7564_t:CDS:1 n=1 Tax=Scutellospora calospora TaxID=85575 RepID=A0ACA9KJA7_9GLOM|nr:7564_t:CDS:2 [Scutellospora calospora]